MRTLGPGYGALCQPEVPRLRLEVKGRDERVSAPEPARRLALYPWRQALDRGSR